MCRAGGGLPPTTTRRRGGVRLALVARHLLLPNTWLLASTLRRGTAHRTRALTRRIGVSWLDVRLGLRMLVKHPGLTVAGGMGMTVAIGLGAGFFDFSNDLFNPSLPLDEGGRVVGVQNWDVTAGRAERRSLHDFRRWRSALGSVETLGTFRTIQRNLITFYGPPEPVPVAEITASGLSLSRVPPLLGRPLLEDDERAGAPPVVVISHDLWQTRFAGDSDVVGSSVRLGASQRTVVGVMPPGFRFPINHVAWVPLPDPAEYTALEGPPVFVFGRLRALSLAGLSVLLLTTLGVHALMSFTVAQRRREIGIRSALGADPRPLLLDIFCRSLGQLSLGALAGAGVAVLLDAVLPQGLLPPEGGVWPLLAVAAVMVGIGALSAIGPARQGLRIEPTEALRGG